MELCYYFEGMNDGDAHPIYTRDTWTVPESGTEIWCSGWDKKKKIKPYGDGAHVLVNESAYHREELMNSLKRWEKDGFSWGMDGVVPIREQQIHGKWVKVERRES